MSASPDDRKHPEGFTIEPTSQFFEASRAFIESDIGPSPSATFLGEVDLTEIEKIRSQSWTRPHISYIAFVIKAVALALRDFPQANRRVYRVGLERFPGSRMQAFTDRDVAVAVERDLPGIEVSTLLEIFRAADLRSLDEITTTVQGLSRADAGTNPHWQEASRVTSRFPAWLARKILRRPWRSPTLWMERRGGAVLVNSPPREGVEAVVVGSSYPISVSFGQVKSRPVVDDGVVVARPTFHLSMSFDRRIMTGIYAARFFRRIVAILEKPIREFEDFKVTSGSEISVPIIHEPKRPAPRATIDPPPTRTEFPTIESPPFQERDRSLEAPPTRDEFPTIDE
jgi:2-oxoacid dehydrogenases acyltransferase (catalytic domain)